MANFMIETALSTTSFVPISSRYSNSKVLYYTEHNKLTFNTYKKGNNSYSSEDKYAIITSGVEYRPDLVSQQAYGTVDFWWKILEANNMKDIWQFKAGKNIRIPKANF